MVLNEDLKPRQLWAIPTSTVRSIAKQCRPFTLPSNGVLTIDQTAVITLTEPAVYEPDCTGGAGWQNRPNTVSYRRDPFYASTLPQIYVVGGATVVAYMLVIMLLITPRTFFVGGPGGGSSFLARRGMISGASGSTSVIGVGGRPWLQKVAALTVAISLTIASVDTFDVAERQYKKGYMDANALTDEVVGGVELRVVRIISDTFLWLAQAQTLIRLFPRHKEKVIIKWTGFAIIVLDTTFSILNKFVAGSNRASPGRINDAIPALSYLFALALSLLYAACVVYYAFSKRRFAFFHSKMRNMCLVAVLAFASILIPVVFFVLDVSKPNVAGWGDYVRWVGAAAASVVVWEWVERIEALERDERKDGILGREIFDLDEMLEVTPSEETGWPGSRHFKPSNDGSGGGMSTGWNSTTTQVTRTKSKRLGLHMPRRDLERMVQSNRRAQSISQPETPIYTPRHMSRPVAATPISRDNTTSAASTEYVLHYHPVTHQTAAVPEDAPAESESHDHIESMNLGQDTVEEKSNEVQQTTSKSTFSHTRVAKSRWQVAKNPFKRRRASPPPEVAGAPVTALSPSSSETESTAPHNANSRLASTAARRWRRRGTRAQGRDIATALPVTVIPAQRRSNLRPVNVPQVGNTVDRNSDQGNELTATGSQPMTAGTGNPDRPFATSDSPVAQQRLDRYSPNDSNGRVLSQRGALTISEERSVRTLPCPSTAMPPTLAEGQASYVQGHQLPGSACLPQMSTQDLNGGAATPIAATPATGVEGAHTPQDQPLSEPLTVLQRQDLPSGPSKSSEPSSEDRIEQERLDQV